MIFDYFDIHSHLSFEDFDANRHEVLAQMKKDNVGTITIGTDLEKSKKALELAKSNELVWATIGMHPGLCGKPEKAVFDEEQFEILVGNPKVVAIGECGLEYFHIKKEETGNLQKELFEKQIDFALKHDKPLMLHCRDSYTDALDILEIYAKKYGDKLRGNAHFFAGDMEVLKRFLNIGFSVSFTGVLTFTKDYDELVRFVPLDMIMSETDAPFVAPMPYRGKRNSPLYVTEVVKAIARIRGEDFEKVKKILVENAIRVFKLV